MSRENKQEMFCYLDHRTPDMKFNIITDVYVTPGNVHMIKNEIYTFVLKIKNYPTIQQTVRVIKNINLIRRNVKTAHFFPNVLAPKIR